MNRIARRLRLAREAHAGLRPIDYTTPRVVTEGAYAAVTLLLVILACLLNLDAE